MYRGQADSKRAWNSLIVCRLLKLREVLALPSLSTFEIHRPTALLLSTHQSNVSQVPQFDCPVFRSIPGLLEPLKLMGPSGA